MLLPDRHAVRAVLLTPEAEVLLIKFVAPQRQFWLTPGGGALPKEQALQTLRRELREEIGRDDFAIGPEIWRRSASFSWNGNTRVQHERYFLVPTERFEPPADMLDETERKWFGGFRWWPVDQLHSSCERFAPRRLARFLERVVEQGPPREPVDVGR